MSYGLIYTVKFKNRILNDIYSAEIFKKDYTGLATNLAGADSPLTLTLDDNEILNPIRATRLTLSFLNMATGQTGNPLKIEDFYSDDDQAFRVYFYFVSTASGSGTKTLLFSGYIIQDDSSEPDTDKKHYITLKATDNLALLKSVPWDKTNISVPGGKYPLIRYLNEILQKTGLYKLDLASPESLPFQRYFNIFENTMPDRQTDLLTEGALYCFLHSSVFQQDAQKWDDSYNIITKMLTDLNASLVQAVGKWVVFRPAEFSYFIGGIVPGRQTQYVHPVTQVTAVQTNPIVNIKRSGGDVYPIEEDLTKFIQRPIKQVINTFTYQNPESYIIQADLSLPPDAVPFATSTSGGIKYDSYYINTATYHYFPNWTQTHNDNSYLVVSTDVATGIEKERYIRTPGATSEQRGVQLNPIEVTKGDVLDFTMQYRMDVVDHDGSFSVFVRFVLISDAGKSWHLTKPSPITDQDPSYLIWTQKTATQWDDSVGIYLRLPCDKISSVDWRQYSLSGMIDPNLGVKVPAFPESGMLLIEVRGTNGLDGMERQTTFWKDPQLTITNFLNDTAFITGHKHDQSAKQDIKAIQENSLNIDDAPRSTISGALFTDKLTNFEYTDEIFGTHPNIGQIFFTRTLNWHRAARAEALRLGDIITRERLQMLYTSRYVREGTFRNVRYDTDKFINPLSLYSFEWLPGRYFFATSLSIDYMNNSFRVRLQEIFKATETDFVNTYLFTYQYKTE